MKIGDLVEIGGIFQSSKDNKYNGAIGIITDFDDEQGSAYVITGYGLGEFHVIYCEVISESR